MSNKVIERNDDFETRSEHLKKLSDAELKKKFWGLIDKIVDPLLDIADKQTSASVERSVLLRMGFSSIESKAIVNGVTDRGLLSLGAGHVVFKVAKEKNLEIRQVGLELIEGKHWEDALQYFGK